MVYKFPKVVLSWLLASGLVAGCGDSASPQPVIEVTGRVFLDDEPLRFGQVVFQPLSGGQPAIGKLEPNGKFSLGTYGESDGATIGRHRVRIVSYSSQDPGNKDVDSMSDTLGDLTIPERYSSFATSGIEVSVLREGNSPFIFKLESESTDPDHSDSPEANAEPLPDVADDSADAS
ncbi:hypothetical protein [Aeoliella sp.]|uniref:hypothetical protein n=1 Tax=Aeoliella sp. TaxID=2795800 RepID=UPI003CCC0666